VSATFVGNGVNGVERDRLLQRRAIRNGDQVDYLALQVHPYNKKYFISAFDPDSLSNPRYSHNSYTHLYLVDP
jgi:hypothetical protein